jgi:hypothetical protein
MNSTGGIIMITFCCGIDKNSSHFYTTERLTPVTKVVWQYKCWLEGQRPRSMSAETYKGIEFVRISNLPDDQKNNIRETIEDSKIIKILRGKELLHDCVQVRDYAKWMKENFNNRLSLKADHQIPTGTISSKLPSPSSK